MANNALAAYFSNPRGVSLPQSSDYVMAGVEKPVITKQDGHVTDDNAFLIPSLSSAFRNRIVEKIQATDHTFLFGANCMPMMSYHGGTIRWLSYQRKAPAVSPYAMEGSIPEVSSSVQKYQGTTQRHAVRAKFNIPEELQNASLEVQGLLVYKMTVEQLAEVAIQTICEHNVRVILRTSDALRDGMNRRGTFASWSMRDYLRWIKRVRGSANRNNGAFMLMLEHIEETRRSLSYEQHTHLILHVTTRALLRMDRANYIIGGPKGVNRFEKDPETMDSYQGYQVEVVRDFMREGDPHPVNHFEKHSYTGEFYPCFDEQGNAQSIAIYNEEADNWRVIDPVGIPGTSIFSTRKDGRRVVVRDKIVNRMACSVTHTKGCGATLVGGFNSIGSTVGSIFAYMVYQEWAFGGIIYSNRLVHVLWDTTYLRYVTGKGISWCDEQQYIEWVNGRCSLKATLRRPDCWAFAVPDGFEDEIINLFGGKWDPRASNGSKLANKEDRELDNGLLHITGQVQGQNLANIMTDPIRQAIKNLSDRIRTRGSFFRDADPTPVLTRGTCLRVDQGVPQESQPPYYTGDIGLDGPDRRGIRAIRSGEEIAAVPVYTRTVTY